MVSHAGNEPMVNLALNITRLLNSLYINYLEGVPATRSLVISEEPLTGNRLTGTRFEVFFQLPRFGLCFHGDVGSQFDGAIGLGGLHLALLVRGEAAFEIRR